MALEMYEYIEVNLIGVVLLLTLLLYGGKKRHPGQGPEQRCFLQMLVLNALILLADNGIYLLRGHRSPQLILLNHFFCLAYFIMQPMFCYDWVRYVLLRLYPRCRPGPAVRAALLAPLLSSIALAAASPWTGWLYTLSGDNTYSRGALICLPFAAAVLYWLTSSVLILQDCLHPARSREPEEYAALFIFPFPLLIGNLLQLRFYGLSIVWVAAAVSMLILFIDIQSGQLARDELTGLFNRRQANAQLRWEAEHLRTAGDLLAVAMLDVDHFKQINDHYGHLEGDRALTLAAKALKENCRKSDFASRLGGDEFLLISHVRSSDEAAGIIDRLQAALEAINRQERLPYALSLSAGYTLCTSSRSVTADDLLNEADARMYAVKRQKQSCRITDAPAH